MQNVVVVTLNYRLGLFGFLPVSVDGNGPRGNYGLMDQIAALHWIQENIGSFGGDAENVTLVGNGFGAACVNLLMISPMASPSLFSHAILLSGSALSPGAIARDADTFARLLAKSLNCPLYDNSLMVECLRSKPMRDLLAVDLIAPDYITAFGPIIDGIVIPSEPQPLPLTDEVNPSVSASTPYDLLFGTSRSETPVVLSHEERHKNAKPLPDHRNSHVGAVRQISFHFNSSPSAHNSTRSSVSLIDAKTVSPEAKQDPFSRTPPLRTGTLFSTPVTASPSPVLLGTQSHHRPNISSTLFGGAISRSNNQNNRSTQATPIVMESGRFGPYVYVIIILGTVLLVTNIFIFIRVFRNLHRSKGRKDSRSSDEEKGDEGKYEDVSRMAHESVSADQNEMSEANAVLMQPHQQLDSSPRLMRHQYHVRGGTTGGVEDDELVLYTDLDLYAPHHHHQHSHQTPDVHGSRCINASSLMNGGNAACSPPASTGTSSHHHVHFLHPHLSQVQILDSSDGLLDPQIVTSVCNNSSMFSRNSFVTS